MSTRSPLWFFKRAQRAELRFPLLSGHPRHGVRSRSPAPFPSDDDCGGWGFPPPCINPKNSDTYRECAENARMKTCDCSRSQRSSPVSFPTRGGGRQLERALFSAPHTRGCAQCIRHTANGLHWPVNYLITHRSGHHLVPPGSGECHGSYCRCSCTFLRYRPEG